MRAIIVMVVCAMFSGCVASEDDVELADGPVIDRVGAELAPAQTAVRPRAGAAATLSPPNRALWSVSSGVVCELDDQDIWVPTRIQFGRYSDGSNVVFMLFDSGYSDETTWAGLDATSLETGVRPLTRGTVLRPAIWTLASDGKLRAALKYEDATTHALVCTVAVAAVLE